MLAHGLKRISLPESAAAANRVRASIDLATLGDESFVDFVEGALDSAGIKASSLTLVLNRNLVMGAVDQLLEVVEAVHKLGVKIALEGIVGSQAEVEFIQRFPITSVELDHALLPTRSTRQAVDGEPKHAVKTMHNLGIEVIMSGIEDSDDLGALWSWGVDYACGNFIQTPMQRANYDFE
jgi:EAL domain-containing protein (putative c-di-GMP-specific phosphodiesterase class I)